MGKIAQIESRNFHRKKEVHVLLRAAHAIANRGQNRGDSAHDSECRFNLTSCCVSGTGSDRGLTYSLTISKTKQKKSFDFTYILIQSAESIETSAFQPD